MTSPTNVGSVEVEVVASAKALAKSLKAEVEKAFKDLDFSKAIQDSIGKTRIKLPVEPDMDTSGLGEKVRRTRIPKIPVEPDLDTTSIPEKVKRTRVPKVPVEIDPLLAAFQQEVRRQTAALARTANANIPVGADTSGLRAQIGAALAEVKAQTKIQVPTEPGEKATYEAKLKAQLAEVAARVKQTVHVDVDVDKGGGGGSVLSGLGEGLKGLFSAGPSLSGLIGGVGDLVSGLKEAASTGAAAGTSLSGAFSSASGPIGIAISLGIALAGAMTAATVAAYALGPAVGLITAGLSAAAGAAAALPAALVGAGAVVGTLALGFKGIAAAFKPKTGGAGGGGGQDPAARARQVAAAERGVESARRGITSASRAVQAAERGLADAEQNVVDAQKRAQQAQLAINQARADAKEDIEDLNRSLAGAKLSEEDAALGVTEALRALNEAKLTGNLPDIQRADLAYRQAQQTLAEAADTADDLQSATAAANKKGVEGSDKVQSALQDQADALKSVKSAQEGVLDAQNAVLSANDGLKSSYDGLLSAQDSLAQAQAKQSAGAAAAGAATTKLAASAQKFVDAIKALKPAFEDLRLDVQQRLFEGLDKTVTNLGRAWIPALKVTLGSYADTFNGFFKNLGASVTTPKFIADIQAGAEGARQGLAKVGDSITTSLVPAFGTLSRAAGPFLSQLGTEIATIVTKFGEWVDRAQKSGALTKFFDRATVAMHDLFTTGTLVTQIIGDIFEIVTGSGKQASGKSGIDQLNDGLARLHTYLADPQTQQKIRDFFAKFSDAAATFKSATGQADSLITKLKGLRQALFGQGDKDHAYSLGADIGTALIFGIISGIAGANILATKLLGDLILNAPNSVVGIIKNLLGIHSPSTVMMEVGGDMIAGLLQGITDRLPDLTGVATRIRTTVTTALGDARTWLQQHGQVAVDGLRSGISTKLGDLRTTAGTLKTTVQTKLSDAGSWLRTHGQSVTSGFGSGMVQTRSFLSSVAGTFRAYVSNPLSGAASWLFNYGYNTVVGLYNGIASLGGWLYNKVANFIQNNVKNAVKDYLHIGSPSKLMAELGAFTTQGLAQGMLSEANRVTAAAETLAAAAIPALADTSLSMDLSTDLKSVSASLTKSTALEIGIAPGSTGDWLMDGLRKNIAVKWRGDVVSALGS